MDLDLRLQPLGGDTCLVELHGELDVYTCRTARTEFRALLDSPHRRFLLDMGRLTFIDSAGLGMLVRFLRRVRDMGGDLVLVRATPATRKLFRMTGLDALFAFAEDHEQALLLTNRAKDGGDPEDSVLAGPTRL